MEFEGRKRYVSGRARGRRARFALTLVLVVGGCEAGASPDDPGHTIQRRDSAGIEIVENTAPLFTGEHAWTIDPEPLLQIGAREGADAYLFGGISDAVAFRDGRIAVAEDQSREIRVFDADGRHLTTFGGLGEGPGEISGPPALAAAEPDTILVWDPFQARISWFSAEGTLVRDLSVREARERIDVFMSGGWYLEPDGSLWFLVPAAPTRTAGSHEVTQQVLLVRNMGTSIETFPLPPYEVRFGSGAGACTWTGDLFAPLPVAGPGPDPGTSAVSSLQGWQVGIYSSEGSLLRLLRAQVPRTPVTNQQVDAMRQNLGQGCAVSQPEAREMLAQFPIPDSLPPIGTLRRDADGNLWVERRRNVWSVVAASSVHDVFDRTGRWLTTVESPSHSFWILQLGSDRMLTVWTDELEMPYLRVYRIRKPTDGP